MKKKFLALLLCVVAAFALAACGGQPVATVNGVDISQEEYQEYVNYMMAMYGLDGSQFNMTSDMAESLQTSTIDGLVYMEEVKQACEEVGCAPSEDEITSYIYSSLGVTDKATYKDALSQVEAQYGLGEETLSKVIGAQLYSENLKDYLAKQQSIKVSKKAAQKAYDEAPENYDTRTVSHILITPEVAEGREAETDENGQTIYTDEEWAAAEKEAEGLIKKLDNGKDFAKLATKNSDDPGSAQNGGALGEAFTKTGSSFVEEFTEASFELTEVDQYTEKPVKSTYGYHIILCTGIQDKDHDFDAIIKNIRAELLNEKAQAALDEYMEKYASEADVVINYGSNVTTETEEAADETEE